MANLTAVISADTSKFVGGIKSAQEMLNKFVKDTNSVSESTKKNVSATDEQVAAYKRVVQQLEKVGSGSMNTSQQQKALTEQIKELKVQWQNLSDAAKSSDFGKSLANTMNVATEELGRLKSQLNSLDEVKSGESLKRQLRETTVALQSLTVQYAQLSSTEKTSPFGVALAKQLDQARIKAGNLKDVISDVENEIKIMSSDTPRLDAFNSTLSISADLISTYTSLLAKLSGDTNKYKDAITTVITVQSAANLSTKIAAQLQSSSILMLKVRKVQEMAAATAIKIRTAAEGKGTIATKAATAAQAAFNLVAKANPCILLASAFVTAGAAILAFIKHTQKSKEVEEAHQAALNKTREAFNNYAQSVGSAGDNLIAKYVLLAADYKKLTTEHDKITWVKKNQKAFSDLGVSVKSVSDAESVFVRNTGAVIESIKKRAIATAKQNQLTELSAKLLEEQVRAETNYANKQVKAGDKVHSSSHSTAGGNEYVDRNGSWVYTTKGAEEANQKIKKETYATVNQIQNQIDNLAKDIAGSIDVSTLFGSTSSTSTSQKTEEEVKIVAGSLAEANKKVSELKTQLENINPNDESFTKIQSELEEWKKKQAQLNELVNGTKEKTQEVEVFVSGSLKEAEHYVEELSKQLANMSPDDESFQTVLEQLNQWKEKQDKITESINGTKNSIKSTESALDKFVSTYDKAVGSVDKIVSSFNSVYESFKNLNDALSEAENGWEAFFAVFQAGMSILDSIVNTMEAINTIMEVFNMIKQASTAITQKDTMASITNTTAKTAEAGANTMEAGTAGAAAAAKAGESVASIPYVGPVLAIAAIASVMAAIIGIIASAKSFASGGIIDGKNTIGDYNIARVNKGEMILNGTEQKRLFNLLDGNTFGAGGTIQTGQVEFKIKGTELVGCINNVNKKRSKI